MKLTPTMSLTRLGNGGALARTRLRTFRGNRWGWHINSVAAPIFVKIVADKAPYGWPMCATPIGSRRRLNYRPGASWEASDGVVDITWTLRVARNNRASVLRHEVWLSCTETSVRWRNRAIRDLAVTTWPPIHKGWIVSLLFDHVVLPIEQVLIGGL